MANKAFERLKKLVKKEKPPKDYSLIKDIRSQKLYKDNYKRRDTKVRKYVDENLDVRGKKSILPGQLIMFNYFEPKTEEELEYYDAMPCTIFFGIIRDKHGDKRVLGFNLHYYPPRIRYRLMDRIFEIFKSKYTNNWATPIRKETSGFEYDLLINELKKAKLDFGVRMYIPRLMGNIVPIPSKDWSKVVFTEGRFKKRTREAIMNYWKNKVIK